MYQTLKSVSLVILASCQLISGLAHSQTTDRKMRESMRLSCKMQPFVSVSVSTPHRDSISDVQIRLTDPRSREQGVNVSGQRIPRSRYGYVVEIPKLASRSKIHAIEICGAEQGEYALTIYEHGDERYRITVNAEYSFLLANFLSRGRIKRYRFFLRIDNDKPEDDRVYLMWLDENGRPERRVANNDW